ncbi:phage major capsid protein [Atopobacter phocae]|uniref:phage major capsid protein n=1 Tax=Atopobacter phocae TaxID=136492 RepID=UPI00047052B2|nr:phage major capsid protein [Atopobacter phocae]
MVMKLNKNYVDVYNEKREAFFALGQNQEATNEEKEQAFAEMMEALRTGMEQDFKQDLDSFAAASRVDRQITNEEVKFFNEINKDSLKEPKLLPQTTVDEIFEDMVTAHPILSEIGLKNNGLRVKFIRSETSGVAVWGKIFGEIKGQLEASFSEEETISSKLTAFVVVPKDTEKYGPAWIKRFVMTQITEAFATALELAFVTGDGNDKPVGLNRQVQQDVSISGGVYPEKEPTGTLTFADPKTTVKEITAIYKHHSIKENGKPLNVAGKVALLVNPTDAWDVRTQYTHLNANGLYITALPYNLSIIESLAVPAGKVISFVKGRYDARVAGGVDIQTYAETLALEDLTLYIAKSFGYGKAKDDKAAAVWTLKIDGQSGE